MTFLVAGGVLYAIVFWMLAFKRPAWAIMLMIATAPFQQDLGGGPVKFSLAEIGLILATPVALLQADRVKTWAIAVPGFLYLGLCCLASIPDMDDSAIKALIQIFLYLVLAVLVLQALPNSERDFRLGFDALICVGVFLACLLVALRSQFVLGLHKNAIGSSLGVCFLVAAESWFRERSSRSKRFYSVALVIISAGLFVTLSRGAWLSALAGLFFIIISRGQIRLAMRLALVLIPLIAILWATLPSEKREYAVGFDSGRKNIEARYQSIDLALEKFRQNPLLGVGVALRKEMDATNLVMVTLGESGVLGLGAFLFVHVFIFVRLRAAQQWLPPDDIAFTIVTLAGALLIARFAHGMVDHYWTRGPLLVAWGSVGMAMFAIANARRRILLELLGAGIIRFEPASRSSPARLVPNEQGAG